MSVKSGDSGDIARNAKDPLSVAALRRILGEALSLELPYPERPPRPGGKPAAVLALFGEHEGEPALLLTRRTETVDTHKGQMAFPGGKAEPHEIGMGDGAVRTALRETDEEVGIPASRIEVVGELPGLWTVTGFWVTPVVGFLRGPAHEVEIRVQAMEIAETLWIPLARLLAPGTYARELMKVGAVNYPIHVFQVDQYRIWGATGAMIKNLLDRIERVR